MQPVQYDSIAQLEHANWWYESRRRLFGMLIKRYCPGCTNALDIGCGTGANMRVLSRYCPSVAGIDISPAALAYCRKKGLKNVRQGSITSIPFDDSTFGLVLCSDVLEHVDDEKAIAEIHRVLQPGGHAILGVPAFPALWNDNDDLSQHLRRYRARDVRRLLHDFTIQKLTYWNASLFLPAWLIARKQRLFPNKVQQNNLSLIPRIADSALKAWFGLENAFAAYGKLPFGVSVIAVARKD